MKFNGSKSVELEPHPASKRPAPGRYDKNLGLALEMSQKQQTKPTKDSTRDACVDGLVGCFTPVRNDFTILQYDNNNDGSQQNEGKYFINQPHWNREKREHVKRVRFVICSLGLVAVTLGLMSRMFINLAIVEMTENGHDATNNHQPQSSGDNLLPLTSSTTPTPTTSALNESAISDQDHQNITEFADESTGGYQLDDGSGLHFDWSEKKKQLLLASFYMGYAPTMLFSGNFAEKYGAKYPLLLAIFGSSVINLLTPLVAGYSFTLLVAIRILLGVLQASTVPSIYELFNKWLTITETSVFLPLLKMSMAFGSFAGSSLPGITSFLGYHWPVMFYIGSSICAIWSLVWFLLATSEPKTNKFVTPNELHKIVKKKVKTISADCSNGSQKANGACDKLASSQADHNSRNELTPWCAIITHPSVIALAIVKLTYNIGMDFLWLELALYLSKIHHASTKTISAINSGGYLLHVILAALVGLTAKYVIQHKTFGFSRTQWRKVFQGISNFGVAIVYFIMPFVGPRIGVATFLILAVFVVWMSGAGGEPGVPFDLSHKYPATIAGIVQAVSVLSGFIVPVVVHLVLGEDSYNPERWNRLFVLFGAASAFGGLVFSVVLVAKPFLPGETEKKAAHSSLQNQQNGLP